MRYLFYNHCHNIAKHLFLVSTDFNTHSMSLTSSPCILHQYQSHQIDKHLKKKVKVCFLWWWLKVYSLRAFLHIKKLADFSLLDNCLLILYIRDLMHVTIIIKKTCIYLRVYKDLPPVFFMYCKFVFVFFSYLLGDLKSA